MRGSNGNKTLGKPSIYHTLMKQTFSHLSFLAGILLLPLLPLAADNPLDLVFKDNSAAFDPENVWISFDNGGGATPFDVTYDGGTPVTIGSGPGGPNHLSDPIRLSSVSNHTFRINSVSSVAVFVSYGKPFTDLSVSPSFFEGAPGADVTYQNFEITRTGGSGDQGNLTNINYFTAPMSIGSYSSDYNGGITPLQSTGFTESTATIANRLAGLSNANAVTDGGSLRRYVGPSTWTSDPPYPSFAKYLKSVHDTPVPNTIQNHNAFNTDDGTTNYDFTFSLQSAVASDNSIELTGSITTMVKDNNSSDPAEPGKTYADASITLSGANMSKLDSIIYGQTAAPDALNEAVTYGPGWSQWAAFVQNTDNDLTGSFPTNLPVQELTLTQTAIGEITTAILMGFLGNTTEVDDSPLNTLPSEDWWKLVPMRAFDEIQSDPDFYNQWADVIYDASGNSVYSIPFSDRLGSGPLVNTVQFTIDGISYAVDRWEVGFGDPVSAIPEPGAVGLLLAGLAGACIVRRREHNQLRQGQDGQDAKACRADASARGRGRTAVLRMRF